jgi:hypothetical protein
MIDLILDNEPASRYAEEILSRAGLTWRRADLDTLDDVAATLVLVGNGSVNDAQRDAIARFVNDGGALVVTGGTWGLDELLGAEAGDASEGYIAVTDADHPITSDLLSSLHVFFGPALTATTGTSIATLLDANRDATIGDAVVTSQPGKGATVAIGPNLPQSVLHIQLGREIHEDGVPAPDGTAPVDDGILKTDDGIVLSWQHDRSQPPVPAPIPADTLGLHENYPNGDTPWFARPIADELRAILLKAIAWAGDAAGIAQASVAAWPRGLAAVGLISHDSDGNLDAGAKTTLRVLDEAGIKSTWCHIWAPTNETEYEPGTLNQVAAAGHEIALHYNSLDMNGGTWGRDHLRAQAEKVAYEAGVFGFTSNKNHYLRWEGVVEFFHWLEDEGIQVDQSKGPSKKGNVGFPHGSNQPWFPLDPATGEFIDVLEIPLQFQDLWLTSLPHQGRVTIGEAIRRNGVAHFLFHQVHIHTKPHVEQALKDIVAYGREQGLEWWTSKQINDWERLRRQVSVRLADNRAGVVVNVPEVIEGLGIIVSWPGPNAAPNTAALGEQIARITAVTYAGQPSIVFNLDLPAGESVIAFA